MLRLGFEINSKSEKNLYAEVSSSTSRRRPDQPSTVQDREVLGVGTRPLLQVFKITYKFLHPPIDNDSAEFFAGEFTSSQEYLTADLDWCIHSWSYAFVTLAESTEEHIGIFVSPPNSGVKLRQLMHILVRNGVLERKITWPRGEIKTKRSNSPQITFPGECEMDYLSDYISDYKCDFSC